MHGVAEEMFIHVGLQKTATTTLQEYLFRRHPQIAYLGRPYTDTEVETLIKAIYLHDSIEYDPGRWRDVARRRILPLRGRGRVVGLSEEFLTGSIGADRGLIAYRLRDIMGPARIVITIREQVGALESEYIDTINYRPYVPYERWIADALEMPERSSLRLYDYDRLAECYESVFGPENVGVLLFEEFRTNRRAFLDRLCRFLGVDPEVGEQVLGGAHANPRKSQRMLMYRRIRSALLPSGVSLSRFVPASVNRRVQRFLRGGSGAQLRYAESYRIRLRQFYREGNARLAARYRLPLERFGYAV